MAKARDVQAFLEGEFGKVGAYVKPTVDGIEVSNGDSKQEYKLPEAVSDNYPYLPGWFAAGIWDDMGLPSVRELPDGQLLYGWNFHPAEGTNFEKSIGLDKLLIYNGSNNLLFIKNDILPSFTEVGLFPTKSVFHALKLFEENGFFPETGKLPIRSLPIANYRIR